MTDKRPTKRSNDSSIEIADMHFRLHHSIVQWHAVAVAAETICGLTDFSVRGLALLRSLVSTAARSATETLELSDAVKEALDSREDA